LAALASLLELRRAVVLSISAGKYPRLLDIGLSLIYSAQGSLVLLKGSVQPKHQVMYRRQGDQILTHHESDPAKHVGFGWLGVSCPSDVHLGRRP